MRIPITKYGLPQVLIYPAIILALMLVNSFLRGYEPQWLFYLIQGVLFLMFSWTVLFFRDPERRTPDQPNYLFAPADGKITDICEVHNEYMGGNCVRIGIFLSIFSVHINRAPCKMRVENIIYRKGKYKNALSPESSKVNESNKIRGVHLNRKERPIIIRQISGAVARRIVCDTKPPFVLRQGQKFGMIKFGSRTELYITKSEDMEFLVKKGQKVKAGLTPLLRYTDE